MNKAYWKARTERAEAAHRLMLRENRYLKHRLQDTGARVERLEAALWDASKLIYDRFDMGNGEINRMRRHVRTVLAEQERLREAIAPQPGHNQCDGCARGLPIDEHGIHRGEGYDVIACTADRYAHGDDNE